MPEVEAGRGRRLALLHGEDETDRCHALFSTGKKVMMLFPSVESTDTEKRPRILLTFILFSNV
jgi:hypothetical protein